MTTVAEKEVVFDVPTIMLASVASDSLIYLAWMVALEHGEA